MRHTPQAKQDVIDLNELHNIQKLRYQLTRHRTEICAYLLTLLLIAFTLPAWAQTITVIDPFAGSTPSSSYEADFDQVTIFVDDGDGQKTEVVEGQVRAAVYVKPADKSAFEVGRAFQMALEAEGFEILFSRRLVRQGTADFGNQRAFRPLQDLNARNLVNERGLGEKTTSLQRIYTFPSYYLSATRTKDGEEITIAITISDDRHFYLLEQITKGAIEDGNVSFSEDTLSRGIDTEGRAILYGVQFDVGSSVLRPSSEASVEVIASVLRARSGNFYVVGHTSDTGEFQMTWTSGRDRAVAIIDVLGRDYGIDTSRLTPIGVGPAAPLASNQNEEGRALNRRVELVERLEN